MLCQNGQALNEEAPVYLAVWLAPMHTLPGYLEHAFSIWIIGTITQIDVNETGQTNDVDGILSYVN